MADKFLEVLKRELVPTTGSMRGIDTSAILGALAGRVFPAGEGLVLDDPDATIANICRVAREGMRSNDVEILGIMTA